MPLKPQKKRREGQESDSSSSSDKEQPIPYNQHRDSLRLKADPLVRAAYEAPTTGRDEVAEVLIKRFDITEEDLEAEREWFERDQKNARLAKAILRRESEEREVEEEVVVVEESESEESEREGGKEELTEQIHLGIGEILENYEIGASLGDIFEAARDVRRRQRERKVVE